MRRRFERRWNGSTQYPPDKALDFHASVLYQGGTNGMFNPEYE